MQRTSQRSVYFCFAIFAALLLLIATDLSVTAQESKTGTGINLFYVARRNSQIEPCGCHTKQRGGLFYEAALYDEHNDAPSIRVDAGEFTKTQINDFPLDAYRNRFLLRGLTMLHFDAVNMGLNDIENHAAFFESVFKDTPAIKDLLISANVYQKAAPDQLAFPPYKIVERQLNDGSSLTVGILGATATNRTSPKDRQADPNWETHDYVAKPAGPALGAPLAELAAKTQIQILLFSGSYEETMDLARQFPELDYIITTGRFPDSTMPLYIEGTTRLLQIQNFQAKELAYAKLVPGEGGAWVPAEPPQSLAVAVELPMNMELKALSDEFNAAIKAADQNMTPVQQGKRNYAGAARCLTCHQNYHKDWSSTAHSTALVTLINTGDQFRNECTQCHTTGADDPNGFLSVTHGGSRGLYNVQCESCHGAAREHADIEQRLKAGAEKWMKPEQLADYKKRRLDEMPSKTVTQDVCIRCHDAANDPTFNFEKDLPLVSHAKVVKVTSAPAPVNSVDEPVPAVAPSAPVIIPTDPNAH